MPEVSVQVGGRSFKVACGDGEQDQVRSAAALLDAEAANLGEGAARLSEGRLMLMAGLLLADKFMDQSRRLAALETAVAEAEARAAAIAEDAVALQNSQMSAEAAEMLIERMTAKVEALADGARARA